MEPVLIWQDLQTPALIPHGIVVDHDAIFVHTQNVGEG